jgi:hypothetical protein
LRIEHDPYMGWVVVATRSSRRQSGSRGNTVDSSMYCGRETGRGIGSSFRLKLDSPIDRRILGDLIRLDLEG